MVVHGDDFMTLGDDDALGQVEHVMSSHYTIMVWAILGASHDHAKEVRIMNRYVRWNSDGQRSCIEYEPDPRHCGLTVKSLNLESAKGSDDSISQEEAGRGVGDVSTVGCIADETSSQRGDEGSAAYLSQDRVDLSYLAKELAKDRAENDRTINDKRYLKTRPRLLQLFVEQTSTANVVRLDVYDDSDHAVCLKTYTHKHNRHGVDARCTVSQSVTSHAINQLTQKW